MLDLELYSHARKGMFIINWTGKVFSKIIRLHEEKLSWKKLQGW